MLYILVHGVKFGDPPVIVISLFSMEIVPSIQHGIG